MTPRAESGDYPDPWFLPVRGTAPTVRQHSGKVGETNWRVAIRDKVHEVYPHAPYKPTEETQYTVKIVFRMTAEELTRPAVDLDNLAQPVLNTIFTSDNVSPKKPTGVLLSVNDTWVFRLYLEKVQVDSRGERGADITVTTHASELGP
jgi:hypothetical protein